jgi:hypothetical protein
LNFPDWAIYVNCRRQVSVLGEPVLGFFAFLNDRFTRAQRFWPELQIIAFVDGAPQREIRLADYYVPLIPG